MADEQRPRAVVKAPVPTAASPRLRWVFAALALAIAALVAWTAMATDGLAFEPGSVGAETEPIAAAEAALDGSAAAVRRVDEAAASANATATAVPATSSAPRPARDRLRIRVVDARTKAPVAGAQVATQPVADAERSAAAQRARLRAGGSFAANLRDGQVATTDQDGVVFLRVRDRMLVAAQAGDRFGIVDLELEAIGPDGLEVRIGPSPTLTVRVVDAEQRPLARVPLGFEVCQTGGDRKPTRSTLDFGATDASGTLTLRRAELYGPDAVPSQLAVFVRAPGLAGTRAVLAADQGTVELTLRSYGSLRVRATDRSERPLPDLPIWTVALNGPAWPGVVADDEFVPYVGQRDLGLDGEVEFPYLGLGLELDLGLWLGSYRCARTVAGPVHAGQQLVQTIALAGEPHYALRARLLGRDGVPLAGAEVSLFANGGDHRADADTDAAGRLEVRFLPSEDGETQVSLRLTAATADGVPHWLEPIAMTLGQDRDFGDLRLDAAELVARGVIVEERPRPPELELRVEDHVGESGWVDRGVYRVVLADDATFAIHRLGPAVGQLHRLLVRAPGCEPIEPIEFAPGQSLRVVLRPGAHFLARLQLDPAVAWYSAHAGLDVLLRGDDDQQRYLNGRFRDGEWWFETWSLKPGIYTVAVEAGNAFDDLARLDGVRVEAGGAPDARLLPWDLRPSIQLLTVRTVSADGRRLAVSGFASRRRALDGEWETCGSFEDGVLQALTLAEPADLLFTLHGYGMVRRAGVLGALDLVLQEPAAVTMQLDELPPLLAEAPLRVDVRPTPGWAAAHALPEHASPIVDTATDLGTRSVRLKLVADVEATVHFICTSEPEVELAVVLCALATTKTTVRVAVPPAVTTAMARWCAPK